MWRQQTESKAGEKPKFYFITKSFYAVLIPEM